MCGQQRNKVVVTHQSPSPLWEVDKSSRAHLLGQQELGMRQEDQKTSTMDEPITPMRVLFWNMRGSTLKGVVATSHF